MILLEPGNRILEETVANKINHNPEEKRDACDVRLCDFDDVSYRVLVDAANPTFMQVAINMPCWRDIESKGGRDAVTKNFGKYVSKNGVDGYDVTLDIQLDAIAEGEKAELIKKISLMKTILLGGIFDQYFTDLEAGKTSAPFKFALRSDTIVYLFPSNERVVVIFAIDFIEATDNVIAKIFLQEFVETRRRLGAAPPVSFMKEPPQELAHYNITESDNKLGYVSFAILQNNVDRGKKERVVNTIQSFRYYLQYHIKCAKSHFHSRMRARCVSLLQVLNRAKNEAKVVVIKRTVGGKVFERK